MQKHMSSAWRRRRHTWTTPPADLLRGGGDGVDTAAAGSAQKKGYLMLQCHDGTFFDHQFHLAGAFLRYRKYVHGSVTLSHRPSRSCVDQEELPPLREQPASLVRARCGCTPDPWITNAPLNNSTRVRPWCFGGSRRAYVAALRLAQQPARDALLAWQQQRRKRRGSSPVRGVAGGGSARLLAL
eukprot:TRINITY_DN12893_c0_g1_i1.p2 TRINITY_DN12893_c0_g1~~TRINITY_DN12893_c0_g1_i1.p2  ORF type:complete len:184 (-),score=42.19 TRINITY_DN12893_c0_g1_i1:819-1370(-)